MNEWGLKISWPVPFCFDSGWEGVEASWDSSAIEPFITEICEREGTGTAES